MATPYLRSVVSVAKQVCASSFPNSVCRIPMVMNEEKKNTNWQCKWVAKPKQPYSNPVLIVGVPGIANVGKIAVDFIIEQKKAKKIAEFFSFDLPHLVFVREDNLAYLPKLEV